MDSVSACLTAIAMEKESAIGYAMMATGHNPLNIRITSGAEERMS